MGALQQSVIERSFDRGAERYDKLAVVQRRVADRVVENACAYIKAANAIADLGCGSGYLMARCRDMNVGASLVGVDIAPAMLDLVRSKDIGARLCRSNLEKTPLVTESVDLVVSTSAMQWVNLSLALKEAARLTRIGGHVVISCYLKETLKEWRDLWGSGDGNMSDLSVFECAVNAAPFEVISLELEVLEQRCDSFAEALSSVRDLGAGAIRRHGSGLLGRKRYQRIRNQVDQVILSKGYFSMKYHTVHLVAQKTKD